MARVDRPTAPARHVMALGLHVKAQARHVTEIGHREKAPVHHVMETVPHGKALVRHVMEIVPHGKALAHRVMEIVLNEKASAPIGPIVTEIGHPETVTARREKAIVPNAMGIAPIGQSDAGRQSPPET